MVKLMFNILLFPYTAYTLVYVSKDFVNSVKRDRHIDCLMVDSIVSTGIFAITKSEKRPGAHITI